MRNADGRARVSALRVSALPRQLPVLLFWSFLEMGPSSPEGRAPVFRGLLSLNPDIDGVTEKGLRERAQDGCWGQSWPTDLHTCFCPF